MSDSVRLRDFSDRFLILPRAVCLFVLVIGSAVQTTRLCAVGQDVPAQPASNQAHRSAAKDPPAQEDFRQVRSVVGSKGSEQGGRFVIEDPRTIFYAGSDHKVIVYFEWEGSLGLHHMKGSWKNPEGKVVVISDFDYQAKQRIFGSYWTLTLSDDIQPGLWALEAEIDGRRAGLQAFQIVAAPPAGTPTRRMFTPAEIYKQATAATFTLKKQDSQGATVGAASGFFIKGGLALTAFDAVDDAQSLQAVLPDGRSLPVDGVLAWNRVEDWALLKITAAGAEGLTQAKPNSWSVGDDYFSLQASVEGNRSIVEGSITGTPSFPEFGRRLQLSLSSSAASSGSPVLNAYGEVIGVAVHSSLLPGSWSLAALKVSYPANLASTGSPYRLDDVLAVPVDVIQIPGSQEAPQPLAHLASTGQFVRSLRGPHNVSFGTLARSVQRTGPQYAPTDSQFEFSRRNGQIALFINWTPREKIRSQLKFRVYNLANQLVEESKPRKFSPDVMRAATTWWKLDTGSLSPGLYRIDVMLGDDPAWRTFFRIVP